MGSGSLANGRNPDPSHFVVQPDDDELVRQAQAGDRDAFVALYRSYVHEIYGYLLNQVGDPQDAEDLVSETFLRLVRSLDQFEGRSSFRTWLYEIARNQMRDHWRRNSRRPRSDTGLDLIAEAPPTPSATNPEARAFGQAILEGLPPHYRKVLELRIIDGRSVRDTAEELGKTETNVKVLTHRALKKAAAVAEDLMESSDG